jgi:hypothetical protein
LVARVGAQLRRNNEYLSSKEKANTSINLGNVLTIFFPIDTLLPELSAIFAADCSFAFKMVNTTTRRINNVVLLINYLTKCMKIISGRNIFFRNIVLI